jgi:hypothetical protein
MANELMTPLVQEITERINAREAKIGMRKTELIDEAIKQGADLIELKNTLPHGEFMSHCDEHVYVARQQRQNYIKVAKAPLELVDEYKSSGDVTHGIIGLVNKSSGRDADYHSSGNSEDPPVRLKVEKWDQEELNEELKRNPVRNVVYGLKDLEKLTANVLHGGIVLGSIIEHVDITPEQFSHALSREVTHDGDRPRSAVTVAEFTDRLNMYMDLIVQTKGLLDTKPKLKVV